MSIVSFAHYSFFPFFLMFNPKQKLSHLPVMSLPLTCMYTCFHLRYGKELIGWVYNTWLLYQLWKIKVFGYFSKFLFTCRLTI